MKINKERDLNEDKHIMQDKKRGLNNWKDTGGSWIGRPHNKNIISLKTDK